jgi:hypothetical protein
MRFKRTFRRAAGNSGGTCIRSEAPTAASTSDSANRRGAKAATRPKKDDEGGGQRQLKMQALSPGGAARQERCGSINSDNGLPSALRKLSLLVTRYF